MSGSLANAKFKADRVRVFCRRDIHPSDQRGVKGIFCTTGDDNGLATEEFPSPGDVESEGAKVKKKNKISSSFKILGYQCRPLAGVLK
jgi:hypothetical protein